ncbi:MAG: hypothetical protein ACPGJV_00205 [Bacteriovoracaceae bacterium]
MSLRQVSAFLIALLVSLQSLAATTHLRERTVYVRDNESDYRLMIPKDTVAVDESRDYLYLASEKTIKVIPQASSEIVKEGMPNRLLVPYWEVGVAHELQDKKIYDFASQDTQDYVIFHIVEKKNTESFFLKSFAVKNPNGIGGETLNEKRSKEIDQEQSGENELNGINDLGLFSIKSNSQEIIGDGEITIIRDPKVGSDVLLSLDSKNNLIHAYDLRDPFKPQYLESFIVDLSQIESPKLYSNFKTKSNFILEGKQKREEVSLFQLRSQAAVRRTHLFIDLENQIKGNSWTHQFLFLGLFGNVIKFLDEKLGTPDVTVSDLMKDPVISKLRNSASDRDVLEYLKVNNILTEEEFNGLETTLKLNKASGTKWFFTVAIIVGTLKTLKLKSQSPSLMKALNHYKLKVFRLTKSLFGKNKALNRIGSKAGKVVDGVQTALRARLVRNFYNMEYPAHAIKTLGKLAEKNKLITKAELKNIHKKSYKEQFEILSELIEKVTPGLKKSSEKAALKILTQTEMCKVFVGKTETLQTMRKMKAQVLGLLKRHHDRYKDLDLKGIDSVAYLHASDLNTVMGKLHELKSVVPVKSYDALKKSLDESFKKLDEYNELIKGYGTEGQVAKVWDRWAHFTQSYSHFFIPEKYLAANNRVAKFINESTRSDAVKTGKGTVERIQIKGEHAKAAFYLGISDTLGEVISQGVARQSLADPSERSFGSGDNFLELPIGDESLGIHFDLIVHTANNLIGWWMTMPANIAKSNFSFGSRGKVTITNRFFDYIKKSINPINYLYKDVLLQYPVVALTSHIFEQDYKSDHSEDFNLEDYNEFKGRLRGRLTSMQSFGERKALDLLLYRAYVTPQFFMQAEFDKIARSLFNSSLPGTMVSSLVMPLTTGFWPNRAFGAYFGMNNPQMLKLLKVFKAEGILSKIDEDGVTDINLWTESEKASFYNIMLMLEMARESETNPLSQTASIEEQTQWFMKIGKSLFGDDYLDQDLKKLSPIVKMSDPKNPTTEFRYEKEAKKLLEKFDKVKKKVSLLPYLKVPYLDNSFLVMTKTERAKNVGRISELKEVSEITKQLNKAIEALSVNKKAISRQSRINVSVAIYDSLFLLNQLLLNGKISRYVEGSVYKSLESLRKVVGSKFGALESKMKVNRKFSKSVAGQFGQGTDKLLSSNLLLLGSIPLYLWIDDQLEAHIHIEDHITNLVAELQEILFSVSKQLISEYFESGAEVYKDYEDLESYRKIVIEKNELLKAVVNSSHLATEKFLDSRLYRMPKLLATSGPIGMGLSGFWILTHFLLYKNSKGFVGKMTDRFAPGLFKYSLILWLGMSQIDNVIEKHAYLSAIDFINLHQTYYTSLFELALIDKVLESRQSNKDVSIEAALEHARKTMESDQVIKDLERFKERIRNLPIFEEESSLE